MLFEKNTLHGLITTPYTSTLKQRADIFTETLACKSYDLLHKKFGMIDIYASI